MALLHFLSTILIIAAAASPSIATNSEGEALHSLRTHLSDPTNVLQSWDPTLVNPCTWFHVTCDNQNRVIRLDLGNSNISGPLGPELGRLKHLQYLELYRNNFDGQIPEMLGNLENLISLDLFGNKLEGEIPRSFAKLKKLRFFDVSNNDLCGTLPIDGPFTNFPLQRCFSGPYHEVSDVGPHLWRALYHEKLLLAADVRRSACEAISVVYEPV